MRTISTVALALACQGQAMAQLAFSDPRPELFREPGSVFEPITVVAQVCLKQKLKQPPASIAVFATVGPTGFGFPATDRLSTQAGQPVYQFLAGSPKYAKQVAAFPASTAYIYASVPEKLEYLTWTPWMKPEFMAFTTMPEYARQLNAEQTLERIEPDPGAPLVRYRQARFVLLGGKTGLVAYSGESTVVPPCEVAPPR